MFDPSGVPAHLLHADDLGARLEDAGLTSSQPPQQTIYDGWLLRYSPGKAKRARSVNAIGPGRLLIDAKIAWVEMFYQQAGLPCMFRITPYSQPAGLDAALAKAGYVAHDETRVMSVQMNATPSRSATDVRARSVSALEFAETAARLRGSPAGQAAAEAQRISNSPLPAAFLVVDDRTEPKACGSVLVDGDLAGIFNMVTAAEFRGRGIATALVDTLLRHAFEVGARVAYLQVDAANAAACHVYRKFGFRDRYVYWYRSRPVVQGEAR